eukprot:Pgem_evm1s8317
MIEIKKEDEYISLLNKEDKPFVVVHFWASWAPQCKHMDEVMEELAKKYNNVVFAK